MATKVGELYIDFIADGGPYIKGLRDIDRRTQQFQRDQESAFGRAGARMGDALKTALGIGAAGAFAMLTLKAVQAVKSMVATATEFEYEMSRVKAVTNASGREMEQLQGIVLELGRTTKFTANEAAQGVNELAKAGVAVSDIMGGAAAGTLALAVAGELEVAQAAEIAANAMNVFALSGEQVMEVADALSSAANASSLDVSDLADSLRYIGPVATQLHVPMTQVVAVLAQLAQVGIKGQMAGTGIRGMLTSLISPTVAAREAMASLNVELSDAEGNFLPLPSILDQFRTGLQGLSEAESANVLGRIFRVQQLGVAMQLIQGGSKALGEWTEMVSVAGEAERVAETKVDNFRGSLELLRSVLETLTIQIGTPLINALRPFAEGLTEVAGLVAEGDWGKAGAKAGEVLGRAIEEAVGTMGPIAVRMLPRVVWEGTKEFVIGDFDLDRESMPWTRSVLKMLPGVLDEEYRQADTNFKRFEIYLRRKMEELGGRSAETFKDAMMSLALEPIQTGLGSPRSVEEVMEIARRMGIVLSDEDLQRALEQGWDPERYEQYMEDLVYQPERDRLTKLVKEGVTPMWAPPAAGTSSVLEGLKAHAAAWRAETDAAQRTSAVTEAAAKATRYLEENVARLGDAYKASQTIDAWSEAVERSAKAAGVATDKFDAAKLDLDKYVANLQEQFDSIQRANENLTTIMSQLGESGALSYFEAQGWDIGAVQKILIDQAAINGPKFLEALVGADPAMTRDILQKLMNLIWIESEGQKEEAVRIGYSIGEAHMLGYEEGLRDLPASMESALVEAFGSIGRRMVEKVEPQFDEIDPLPAARTAGEDYVDEILGKTATIPPSIESQLSEVDARPLGNVAGDEFFGGFDNAVRTKFADWNPMAGVGVFGSMGAQGGSAYAQGDFGGSGSGSAVLGFANRFLGTPYVFGGQAPGGFDCSGLMWYAYRHFGIEIPRVSQSQWAYGKPVAAPSTGDLVFFRSSGTNSAPGHVGMYAGNGMFLEAPHPGAAVRYSALSSRRDYIGARSYLTYHQGGRIGAQGGSGEVLIHAQAGERVLSQEQSRLFETFVREIGRIADEVREGNEDEQAFNEIFLNKLTERLDIISGYTSREAARLRMQRAEFAVGGLDASGIAVMTQTLTYQIEHMAMAVAEAEAQLNEAKWMQLPQEEINRLAENLFNLRTQAADAQKQLEELAEEAEHLARSPLEDALSGWNSQLEQTQALIGILSYSSAGAGALAEVMMSNLASVREANLTLMRTHTDPDAIMRYGRDAASAVTSMFDMQREAADRGLRDQLNAIDAQRAEWQDAWTKRSDALRKASSAQREALQQQLSDLQRAHQAEMAELEAHWNDRIAALEAAHRAEDRLAQRRKTKSEISSLYAQGGLSEADIRRLQNLREQLVRDEQAHQRETAVNALRTARDAAVEALRAQQQAAERALQEQINVQDQMYAALIEALDAERDAQEQHYAEQVRLAEDAARQQLDVTASHYAEMLAAVYSAMNQMVGFVSSWVGAMGGTVQAAAMPSTAADVGGSSVDTAAAMPTAVRLQSNVKASEGLRDWYWDPFGYRWTTRPVEGLGALGLSQVHELQPGFTPPNWAPYTIDGITPTDRGLNIMQHWDLEDATYSRMPRGETASVMEINVHVDGALSDQQVQQLQDGIREDALAELGRRQYEGQFSLTGGY